MISRELGWCFIVDCLHSTITYQEAHVSTAIIISVIRTFHSNKAILWQWCHLGVHKWTVYTYKEYSTIKWTVSSILLLWKSFVEDGRSNMADSTRQAWGSKIKTSMQIHSSPLLWLCVFWLSQSDATLCFHAWFERWKLHTLLWSSSFRFLIRVTRVRTCVCSGTQAFYPDN